MTYRLPSQLSGAPRRLLSRLASAIAVCLLIPASVAQDRTQRPLPLPDRTASVPAASQQLLQKLRQTIERQETAPVPPAALDQLGAMLKNLQDKLPPDLLPQGLGDVSPDAIQKSLQQPQTQQKLKELLQQVGVDARRGDVPAQAKCRQHCQREPDALAQIGNRVNIANGIHTHS